MQMRLYLVLLKEFGGRSAICFQHPFQLSCIATASRRSEIVISVTALIALNFREALPTSITGV